MSNAVFMIGIATLCETLTEIKLKQGLPWWLLVALIAIGIFADLLAFCDQRK